MSLCNVWCSIDTCSMVRSTNTFAPQFPKTFTVLLTSWSYFVSLASGFKNALCSAIIAMDENKKFEFENSWGCQPSHSYYLGVFLRFRRTFAEINTFGNHNTNYNINSLLQLRVRTHIYFFFLFSFFTIVH